MKILVTGGARSGKSYFAESLYSLESNVTYVATYINENKDPEMQDRINLHQARRKASWQTFELKYQILEEKLNEYVLFDCLSVFTSNMLFHYSKDIDYIDQALFDKILADIQSQISILLKFNPNTIFVTNEVGYGLIPTNHLERVYRDLLGKVNCYVASLVDEVYLVVCGQPIQIKGEIKNEC